jgi:hypothetical protein
MFGGSMSSVSCRALIVTAGIAMMGTSAAAADLGGNCCADLEERIAELEATTVRKGNRKVSLQIYGQVSESIIWWNDGAESNVYVQETQNVQNRLGFQGNARINSDWSAGFKLELQVRAYRSSNANQLSLGASNNVQIPAYNTQSVSLREANWFLRSNTYGTLTVGRSAQAATGTASISLVNPDGFAGPNGAGFASGGYFLRRSGTTGNGGLSALTWQNFAWIRNGDGPHPLDYATTSSSVKYTSPFFLGQRKTSGFLFSADWGMDDAWSVALRYVEDFGMFRVASGASYSAWSGVDRGICSTGASGNLQTGAMALPGTPGPNGTALGSSVDCNSIQASGSLLHVPTGLYLSGGGGIVNDGNAAAASLARTNGWQGSGDGQHTFWWVQGGWQAKLNTLGNTIFWGQYQETKTGLGSASSLVQTVAATDVLNSLGAAAIIRGTETSAWGLGVSQQIDAAAMTLYAGFYNVSTSGTLGAISSGATAKTNAIDDMQLFYTGATIRF